MEQRSTLFCHGKKFFVLLFVLILSGCIFVSVNRMFTFFTFSRMPFMGIASKPDSNVFIEARNFDQPDPFAVDAWVIVDVTRSGTVRRGGAFGGFLFSTHVDLSRRSPGGGFNFKHWRRRFVSETAFGVGEATSICSVQRSWVRVFVVVQGERKYIPIQDAGPFVTYTANVCAANSNLPDILPDENCPPDLTDVHNFLVISLGTGDPGGGETVECKEVVDNGGEPL